LLINVPFIYLIRLNLIRSKWSLIVLTWSSWIDPHSTWTTWFCSTRYNRHSIIFKIIIIFSQVLFTYSILTLNRLSICLHLWLFLIIVNILNLLVIDLIRSRVLCMTRYRLLLSNSNKSIRGVGILLSLIELLFEVLRLRCLAYNREASSLYVLCGIARYSSIRSTALGLLLLTALHSIRLCFTAFNLNLLIQAHFLQLLCVIFYFIRSLIHAINHFYYLF
jgi:hypothetical protein